MRRLCILIAVVGGLTQVSRADSLWERRDRSAYLFVDYRARQVGDLLTLVVSESTELEGLEKRELNKETRSGLGADWKLNTAGDWGINAVLGGLNMGANSQRKLDAKNNSTVDRKFLDRMTVTVVGVLPNGNLVVEGCRVRMLSKELRSLKVTGVVRPADIGAFNTVQSQSIADFKVTYEGKGPETRTLNRNWMGKVFDVVWPF